jgi:uncharacterized protein (TIGR00645 family)
MAAQRQVVFELERGIEWLIFHSRWLLAPFYLGLALALALLFVQFAVQFIELAWTAPDQSEAGIILAILGLVDLTFAGNLVLIVIFSGYENFVSRIGGQEHDRPDWMTKVDFSGLKQKLMASIVAISAVQVLKAFMQTENFNSTHLAWLAAIHVLFLMSMLIMVISDRIAEPLQHPKEKPE